MKQLVRKKVYRFIKNDGLTVVWSGLILLFLLTFIYNHENKDLASVIDITIFSSIIVAMLLNALSKLCGKWVLRRLEDKVKLTSEYKKLMSKYQMDYYCYHNGKACFKNQSHLKKERPMKEDKVFYPVVQYIPLKECRIEIEDQNCLYQIPEEIREHFDELFSVHDTSTVYNQLNIRVDDWKREGNTFRIYTSRTSYYNSLVTNRAMDYPWTNGLTVRDVLEYGPFLHDLSQSRLSNHLGFNGFIISSDEYVPFVKRSSNLSIGKNTYGTSISASLKAKYALEPGDAFNCQGLVRAILREVQDELKIPVEGLEEFSCSKNLIAAYRDLVEGGKPQLVFFLKSLLTRDQIQQSFFNALKGKQKNSGTLSEDGSYILWIHQDQLPEIYLDQDKMIFKGKKYPMTHSSAASVGMFLEAICAGED